MKFSYDILAKLVPAAPPLEKLAELISVHLFEVESARDGVLDVKILPNRYSDAACYFGLAREIAAMCKVPHVMPKMAKLKKGSKRIVTASIAIPHLCRRISVCPVEGISVGKSPEWMVKALEASGFRPINTVVDITNYVMLETGQPLHAFDLDKIEGGELTVRQAREGERVETLGGGAYDLNPSVLVLGDAHYALDIAGIRGGTRAELGKKTVNILMTAGNFDGSIIYKTSKRLGLRTDASARFSHGLHPSLAERGICRALELIASLCGGTCGTLSDNYPKPEKQVSARFSHNRFSALTGLSIREAECRAILKRLGFSVAGTKVTPPPERTDIRLEEDVVEEIARSIGYDALPAVAPEVTLAPAPIDARFAFADSVREKLTRMGLMEIRTRSFATAGEVALENPLSAGEAYLRPSLSSGMRTALSGALRFEDSAFFFEIGRVFAKKTTHEAYEEQRIGIAYASKTDDALRKALGCAESLCGATLAVTESERKMLALAMNDKEIGIASYGHEDGYFWSTAELKLEALMDALPPVRQYVSLPKFPQIVRDISCIVPRETHAGKLMTALKNNGGKLLARLDFISHYDGTSVGEGKKSLSFRAVFGDPERTLADREADEAQSAMIRAAQKLIPFEIR